MVDQAKIHRKAVSGKVEERREAADQLWDNFAVLPDKKQAWEDLHLLTQDEDWDVRRHVAYAIGDAFQHILDKEQAFKDLHELIRDKNGDVQQNAIHALGAAFPYIPDKKQAWDDLHQLTQDEDEYAWWAVHAIRDAFQHIPDKEQAWGDLYRLVQEDSYVWPGAADAIAAAYPHVPDKKRAWDDLQRLAQGEESDMQLRAIYVIGVSFQHITDKEQAWNDLIRLTQEDKDLKVRRKATSALGAAFQYVPDKERAWKYLHELTQDAYSGVQRHAAYALCAAFQHSPDKKQAWDNLIWLAQDEDHTVRQGAANVLANVFPHIPDKEPAWWDLYRLIQDGDGFVWRGAAYAIRAAFPYIHDKEHAWEDLHQLTKHDSRSVRSGVVYALVDAFQHIPDKEQVWGDLHWLTQDKCEDVRHRAADVIGIAFQHIPDRKPALEDLHQLTKDKDRGVRMSANHSLGRVYIFKATEAESEDDFRRELKKALRFFEQSLKETTLFNPSEFCLPFYSSFYATTFEGMEAEDEAQKYLSEAKRAAGGSKNKEILLEAVENLANALTKVHKAREANLDTIQSDLNACSQYCDCAADLIDAVEGEAPGAARVLRIGASSIDGRINETRCEIQEKTRAIWRQNQGAALLGVPDCMVQPMHISDRKHEIVRIAVAQISFELTESFPFIVKKKDAVKTKIFSALDIANEGGANIVCLPELCLYEEWISEIKGKYPGMIVIGGSFYKDNKNICPLIMKSDTDISRQLKITPSTSERGVMGQRMIPGEIIYKYETQFGKFVILICKDFDDLAHYFRKSDIDMIFCPSFNPDNERFHEEANSHVKKTPSYILIANTGKYGGTSIFGRMHKDYFGALVDGKCKDAGDPTYKLCEVKEEQEGVIIADFNLKHKSVQVPTPSDPNKEIRSVDNIEKIPI